MTKKSQAKARKLREGIIDALKKLHDEDSASTYVVVKTKSMQNLSSALNNAIEKLGEGTVKEMLLNVKASLDWMVENKSVSLEDKAIPESERN